MNAFLKHSIAVLYGLLLSAGACAAEGQLQLPDFNGLSEKASESVTITLDAALLGLAARFLGMIDLFIVWWLIVLGIGLAVLYRRRTQPIVVGLLTVYLVIAAGIALIMRGVAGSA